MAGLLASEIRVRVSSRKSSALPQDKEKPRPVAENATRTGHPQTAQITNCLSEFRDKGAKVKASALPCADHRNTVGGNRECIRQRDLGRNDRTPLRQIFGERLHVRFRRYGIPDEGCSPVAGEPVAAESNHDSIVGNSVGKAGVTRIVRDGTEGGQPSVPTVHKSSGKPIGSSTVAAGL